MAHGTSRVVHVRISLLAPPVTARPGGPRLGIRPFLTPDAVAVRVAARIRVAVAIGVAATGSFLPHVSGRRASLLLLLGLLWLPWSCIVLFAADRAGNDLAFFGGPIGDVLALFAVQALAPVSAPTVLLGYLIVIAFALYTGGRSLAAFLGSAALGLTAIASAYAPGDERLSSAALVPFSAAVVALVFLLDRTITLQRQATARSERLQGKSDAILARVADGVVVTDGSSRVLQCNPAAHRIVGRDLDVIGRYCVDVLGLHVGERALDCSSGCPLMVAGAGPDADLGEEVWRYDGGGRRQPLLANASAVAGPDGTVAEVVHSLRDVTRLKQAEEAKTLFLATASHELRTPLTVIAGFASTLLNDPEPDTGFLVDALTAIARRAGTPPPRPRPRPAPPARRTAGPCRARPAAPTGRVRTAPSARSERRGRPLPAPTRRRRARPAPPRPAPLPGPPGRATGAANGSRPPAPGPPPAPRPRD